MKRLSLFLNYWTTRLYYVILLTIYLSGSFLLFSQFNFTFKKDILSLLLHETGNEPVWLFFVKYLIMIFINTSIVILFLTMRYARKDAKRIQIINNINKDFSNYLMNFLYSNISKKDPEKLKTSILEIRKRLSNDTILFIYIDMLRDAFEQTTGKIHERAHFLLDELKYDHYCKAFLHSPNVSQKIFALQIISDFKLQGYEKRIKKLTRSRNDILRSEAIKALIGLNLHENILFLVNMKMSMSLWDINTIIQIVNNDQLEDSTYLALLNSNNDSVSLLGIILIRKHKKFEFKSLIKYKTQNKNPDIREEAFKTFTALAETEDDYDFLIENLNTVSDKNLIVIINSMKYLDNHQKVSEFLHHVIRFHSMTCKTAALRLMMDVDWHSMANFEKTKIPAIAMAYKELLDLNL